MKNQYKPEGAVVVSALLLSLSNIFIKMISAEFSGFQISFVRFGVALALGVPALFLFYKDRKWHNPVLLFWRGLTGAVSMILYYWAIELSSSGRAHLLLMTYPAFVALFGALFFKEKVRPAHVLSIVLCLAGAVFVLYDGSHYSLWGDILALLSAVVSGLAVNLVRQARQENNALNVYLAACVVGVVLSGLLFPIGGLPQAPVLSWLGLAGVGVIVLVAKVIEMWAYNSLSAVRGSILTYLSLPLVLILSAWWLGEVFLPRLYLGIGLILAGLVIQFIPGLQPPLVTGLPPDE